MPKYGVISGPYLPVFSLNTGKYGPEITPYLDTFHAVSAKPISSHWSYSIPLNTSKNRGGHYHIETSPLIYGANQWTGLYMITAFVVF